MKLFIFGFILLIASNLNAIDVCQQCHEETKQITCHQCHIDDRQTVSYNDCKQCHVLLIKNMNL